MEILIVAVVSVCALLIVGARFLPRLRVFALLARTLLVTFLMLMVWWMLLYFQIVNLDAAFLQRYRSSAWLGTLLFFGPPVALGGVYAFFEARRYRM